MVLAVDLNNGFLGIFKDENCSECIIEYVGMWGEMICMSIIARGQPGFFRRISEIKQSIDGLEEAKARAFYYIDLVEKLKKKLYELEILLGSKHISQDFKPYYGLDEFEKITNLLD